MLKVRPAGFAVVMLCGALLYGMAGCSSNQDLASLRKGQMERLLIPGEATPAAVLKDDTGAPPTTPAAQAAPDYAFTGPDGQPVKLSDFKGQVVILNFWATWCAPCKIELPTLGRLQTAYEGQPVKVVAVTVDRDDAMNLVTAELEKAKPLALYRDPRIRLAYEIQPNVTFFPTTIIYGKDGVERARMAAPAEWDSAEAKAVIDAVLKEG